MRVLPSASAGGILVQRKPPSNRWQRNEAGNPG